MVRGRPQGKTQVTHVVGRGGSGAVLRCRNVVPKSLAIAVPAPGSGPTQPSTMPQRPTVAVGPQHGPVESSQASGSGTPGSMSPRHAPATPNVPLAYTTEKRGGAARLTGLWGDGDGLSRGGPSRAVTPAPGRFQIRTCWPTSGPSPARSATPPGTPESSAGAC